MLSTRLFLIATLAGAVPAAAQTVQVASAKGADTAVTDSTPAKPVAKPMRIAAPPIEIQHMRKAIKTSEAPTIAFHVTSYDMAKEANGIAGKLTGTLSLGGKTKTITVPATGVMESGALHVTGSYPLAMSDYDLKAPSLMFGRIKVRDKVTVKFDLLLKS